MYSPLCADSVNFLLQAIYKLLTFSGWYWPHLNILSLIFINPIPLKAPELVMYACFGLIHLPHTETTWSQTLRQLSQHGVRLHINWVNAEWDSTSIESTQKTSTFTKILSFCIDSVDVESHLASTQLTRNETLRQLSLRRMLKNLNKSTNWRTKSKKIQKSYYLAYMCLISAINENKKSHVSVPLIRWTVQYL
jgi:hypothetical protein